MRYALERRRTFIADEQGLGKTVQALATIEADDAFPAVVVCPASMKLVWERETQNWLPHRSVAVLDGRTDSTWTDETRAAEIVVLNYDILDWHCRHARLAGAARAHPGRVALREERARRPHEGGAGARLDGSPRTPCGSASRARRS